MPTSKSPTKKKSTPSSEGIPCLKIALLSPNTLRVNSAGIEQSIYYLATSLIARGHAVEIYCTAPHPQPNPTDYRGIPVHEFPLLGPKNAFYFSPSLFLALRKGNHDIIHAYGYNNMVSMLGLLAKKPHQKYVLTGASSVSSSAFRKHLHAPLNFFYHFLGKKIDKLICVSDYEYALFKTGIDLPAEKYVIIPNGLDFDELGAVKKKKKSHMILSVGRLVRQKGMHRLIASMPEILQKFPDAQLHLVGDGPERLKLEAQSRELRVEKAVFFHGHISFEDRPKLLDLYARADVFSLMADSESQGLVYGMGILTQCHVITTNHSAMKDLIQAGAAVGLDDPNDAHALAQGIMRLFGSPLPRLDLERILWSWSRVTEAIEKVYFELMKEPNSQKALSAE